LKTWKVLISFERFEEGEGNSNADFSLEQKGYGKQQYYRTTNIAPFIENIFYFGEKFSVTPGLRFEYLSSTAKGYSHDDTSNTVFDVNAAQTRTFLLAGLGAQYKFTRFTNAYANFSQAYRPIDYAELTPIGTIAHVDPNLKDADGYNVDLGYRGTVSNFLNFDVSLFFLNYNNRIGLTTLKDAQGNEYLYRTNISRSIHKGLESYIECNFTKWIDPTVLKGGVSIFNSLTYTNAKFTDVAYANNFVEYAPEWIHRVGITYANAHRFSATAQLSEQSKSFSDANNTAFDAGGIVGILPSYKVLDVSASYNLKTCTVRGGVNNFTNEKYFTHRTPEYPGPGIISAVGRNFYLGMTFRL
jgi:Fe(3+) dicitrate transport protein